MIYLDYNATTPVDKKVLEDAENIKKNYLGLNCLFFVNIREPQSIEIATRYIN